jgi:DivIVA domain-containing protein
MDKKTNLTRQELLEHRFSRADRGYDPLEVDEMLDKVIEDYKLFESASPRILDSDKVAKELEELRKANAELKEELEKERNKWKYISRDRKDIHIDNYELLQRIGKLEMIIHERLNMNPDDIK